MSSLGVDKKLNVVELKEPNQVEDLFPHLSD